MKKSAAAICAILFLAACGGSSGDADQAGAEGGDTAATEKPSGDFASAQEIQAALNAAGLSCVGYADTPKADREMGQEGALSVGTCEVEGENVQLVVWKDNGQRDNFSGLAKGFGCEMAKAFGIQSIDWVDGDKWQVTGTSQTLADQIADKLDGKARNAKC